MFKILSLTFLLLTITSSSDCNDFHEGTFVFNDFGTEFKIVRNGNKQTEYTDRGNEIFEYNIAWDSKCTYKLFNAKTVSGTTKIENYKIDTLYCEIVDIEKDKFRVICRFNGKESKTPVITKVK